MSNDAASRGVDLYQRHAVAIATSNTAANELERPGENRHMAQSAHRWMMTEAGDDDRSGQAAEQGGVRSVSTGPIQVAPFVGHHPLDDTNRIFESVHAGELGRRAVLIPIDQGGTR